MDRKEEEKKRNKDRIIIILLLLIIFLGIYIYLGGIWGAQEEDQPEIPQTEEVENNDDGATESNNSAASGSDADIGNSGGSDSGNDNDIDRSEGDDSGDEAYQADDDLNDDDGAMEGSTDRSDIKFGLTFAQRNDIWWKYQKRQDEIIVEAKALDEDKFSKRYTGHVKSEIRKLRYKLKTDYNIDDGALDYILQEGKNGKFNKAVQTF